MLGRTLTAVLLSAAFVALGSRTPAHVNNSAASAEAQQVQATANEIPADSQQEPSPQLVKPAEPDVQPTAINTAVHTPMSNRDTGKQMAEARGWTGEQWLCLEKLWTNESNWRHTVSNYQGSGAYGVPQSLPANKMASAGEDYLTNPRTQIAWGLRYIESRYKTPCMALDAWLSRSPHWY